jgi:hypothetical protein
MQFLLAPQRSGIRIFRQNERREKARRRYSTGLFPRQYEPAKGLNSGQVKKRVENTDINKQVIRMLIRL